MKDKHSVQVDNDHYSKGYDDLPRFISYFYQIDLVRKLNPKKVLEIGIGNKTVSNYLKHNGFNVTTCDLDERLKPDRVADITDLPFKDGSYDTVVACEILEHLKWEKVEKALRELYRVSSKHVIISIPYASIAYVEIILKFPFFHKIFKRPFADLFLRVPLFFKNIIATGEHKWEMGSKSYSKGRIRKTLRKKFIILKEVRPVGDSYHHFFVLRKK